MAYRSRIKSHIRNIDDLEMGFYLQFLVSLCFVLYENLTQKYQEQGELSWFFTSGLLYLYQGYMLQIIPAKMSLLR